MNEEFYDIIARYYDSMQEGIDHDSWAKMLDSFIKEYCKGEPQGEDGKRLCRLSGFAIDGNRRQSTAAEDV